MKILLHLSGLSEDSFKQYLFIKSISRPLNILKGIYLSADLWEESAK